MFSVFKIDAGIIAKGSVHDTDFKIFKINDARTLTQKYRNNLNSKNPEKKKQEYPPVIPAKPSDFENNFLLIIGFAHIALGVLCNSNKINRWSCPKNIMK